MFCILLLASAACAKKPTPPDDVIIDIGGTTAPANTDHAGEPTAPAETEPAEETEVPTEAPTPEPTADPNLTPEPTEVPELPEGQVLWLNTMPTDLAGLSRQEAEAWFADAVFIGDSVTLGWKNYNNNKLASDPAFFGETHFLCEGSYGAGHALEPVSASSMHPVYQGEQHQIWDSIKLMGVKKVFMCFGLNDIAIYGVEGTVTNFGKVCDKILENVPDAKIYIIGAQYMYKGSEMTKLNNTNLRALNAGLRSMCAQRGFKFVDIASHLVDAEGYVLPQYSSDQYVHQTAAAYDIWADILRSVAAYDIVWGY